MVLGTTAVDNRYYCCDNCYCGYTKISVSIILCNARWDGLF
jgi:hypothetical protein